MKFLVIRFSSIGDIVLASPVFRTLKKQVMTAELHFLTKKSFAAVTQHNPYIDHFHYLDNNLDEVITTLKAEDFDYVIDLHNNFRSSKIRNALGKKAFVIDKLNLQKFLLTTARIDIMPGRHITQRSLDTVASFGVKDDGLGLDYFLSEGDKIRDTDLPAAHHAGYIALVIGASYATKKLPVEKLIELCAQIDHPLVLVGGKEDSAEGEAVSATDPVKIYNACGKFTLNESADIIRRSKLVISNDTGLQYIACAFNKQVIALWGGTSPKLDVEPYYGSAGRSKDQYENRVLNLSCQPCSKYGNKHCPLGHFDCMRSMDTQSIAAAAMNRIGIG